jgi:ligand-binding SRPBCC domain-containing protein
MASFEAEVVLPCSVEGLFEFLLRPSNVEKISDPRLGLTFVQAPDVVVVGSRIVFKVQGFGVVQTIEHEIMEVDRPSLIVEQQVKGPMRSWRHEHRLEPHDRGTRMFDRVTFEPPGGVLGFLVKESTVLDGLEDGFEHRKEEITRLITAGDIR